MKLHLVDGTYELFRAHFAQPARKAPDGREIAAVRGLMATLLALLRQADVTHVGFAFDHVVESFRNQMFDGYKTGEGTPEELMAQFPLAEKAAEVLGLVVWPMTEFEADDVLASAAIKWAEHPEVEQVVICSPDKDLAQVVRGQKIVCLDRRREQILDEPGVLEKFGVAPVSIPDFLALVGDAADGIPGIPRWGAKTSASLLERYGHLESIPDDAAEWAVKVRGAPAIAESLARQRDDAALYRDLATLRLNVPLSESLEDLKWRGVRQPDYEEFCDELGINGLSVPEPKA